MLSGDVGRAQELVKGTILDDVRCAKAVQAMAQDLGQRFAINSKRVYLTGMSGRARVANSRRLSRTAKACATYRRKARV